MAAKKKYRTSRVKDLLFPIYLVLDKGGPGLRLHLRNGRWKIERLDPGVTTAIVRATACHQSQGVCVGDCPPGKSCQTLFITEIEFFEVPEGIPLPPSGRSGFVVKRVRKECRCLAPTG